jgi:hypothetical protein
VDPEAATADIFPEHLLGDQFVANAPVRKIDTKQLAARYSHTPTLPIHDKL